MSLFEAILSLGILIIISAVISAAEMSLAGARKNQTTKFSQRR
ncbi:Uncharacterised protein [Pasteurella multocida]|nr:Uncharacterised protein [Pasteurella multocida]